MNTAEGWQKGCTSTGNVTLSEGKSCFHSITSAPNVNIIRRQLRMVSVYRQSLKLPSKKAVRRCREFYFFPMCMLGKNQSLKPFWITSGFCCFPCSFSKLDFLRILNMEASAWSFCFLLICGFSYKSLRIHFDMMKPFMSLNQLRSYQNQFLASPFHDLHFITLRIKLRHRTMRTVSYFRLKVNICLSFS